MCPAVLYLFMMTIRGGIIMTIMISMMTITTIIIKIMVNGW
jgi:hypothetical protein